MRRPFYRSVGPAVAVLGLLLLSSLLPSRPVVTFHGRLAACAGMGYGYSYTDGPPEIFSIFPNSGSTGGGTTVTIQGFGFCNFTSSVKFGTLEAVFTVQSEGYITAVSPSHGLGTVDITVTNAAGTSSTSSADQYTYVSPCSTGWFDGTPLLADVNGDRDADLVFITPTGQCVRLSTNSSFSDSTQWGTQPFFGSRATLAGDITGTGKAALVAVDDTGTWVELSTGTGFANPVRWSAVPFFGSRGTFLADLNGDRKLDLVAVNDSSTWVMLSMGTGFAPPVQWSNVPFFGSEATFAAGYNGDGPAELIAVNDVGIWVMQANSTLTGFDPPTEWWTGSFFGNVTTLSGHMNALQTDLVAVNNPGVWVSLSGGSSFGGFGSGEWYSGPFYGTKATLIGAVFNFGHVQGKADLVAVNGNSIWVLINLGGTFNTPAQWG